MMRRSRCYEFYLNDLFSIHHKVKKTKRLAYVRYKKYTLCEYQAMVCFKRAFTNILRRRVERAKLIRLFRRMYRNRDEWWRCRIWFHYLGFRFCVDLLKRFDECYKECCYLGEAPPTKLETKLEVVAY